MKKIIFYCISFALANLKADWATITLSQLSLEEKIGQLFIVATVSDTKSDFNKEFVKQSSYNLSPAYVEQLIKKYHIGGIIYLGKNSIKSIREKTIYYQSLSKIPLLIGLDAEWGLSMRTTDGIGFPKARTLGALNNPDLVYETARTIGQQLKQLGIHINFAPVADVHTNPLNPIIHDRSFGDDPLKVAQNALAYARGLADAGIMACAKHFPGHGDTALDSHKALPIIKHEKERLEAIELVPFKQLIAAHIPAIMIAHLEMPALEKEAQLPATLSHAVVTQLLQDELHFKGLKITDGLGMQGVTDYHRPGELEVKALLAGNDILLCPVDVEKAATCIKAAIEHGRIPLRDLDAHVLKILQTKECYCGQTAHHVTKTIYHP